MRNFILFLLILLGLIFPIKTAIRSIEFTQNCGGYLKQAADANTIGIAKNCLTKAILYLEENNLTEGYTSIVYKTPEDDIGFWYNNLSTSLNELLMYSDNLSPLESSNILLKLRETLLDDTKNGTEITIPPGISRYPNNTLYAITNALSIALLLYFVIKIKMRKVSELAKTIKE